MSGAQIRGRLEALALLVVGLGAGVFALFGEYTRLMNPRFRWVTIGGAALVTIMALALLTRPRKRSGPGALVVFGLLFLVIVVGSPFSPGVALVFPRGEDLPPPLERDGYVPLEAAALFRTLDEEAEGVPEGSYVMPGIVYRSAALDAAGDFVLLDPVMACCLADAIALGVRVKAGGALPEPNTWVYVYGRLRLLETPVVTAAFRLGAIVFTNVSRDHVLDLDETLSFRSLLADVVDQVPSERCAVFRRALESTGLADELRGTGPFTVFVPLDLSFDRLPATERETLFAPAGRDRLRALLEDFVVLGQVTERDLYETSSLTTMSGRVLSVGIENGKLRIERARVLFGDQVARNGVLHIVHPAWFEPE